MSTLWTPSGEHPVDRQAGGAGAGAASPGAPDPVAPGTGTPPPVTPGAAGEGVADAEELARLQQELADAPVEIVVANHCFGLFELAAVYLSQQPEPLLEQARLAIDALGCLVEGLAGRLGEPEPTLRDGLAQLRLAYVQLESAPGGGAAPGNGGAPGQRA